MSELLSKFELYKSQIDSLPLGKEKIDIMNQYAWEVCRIDPILGLSLSEDANKSSKELNYKKGLIGSLRNIGQCNLLMANLKDSLKKGLECIELLEQEENRIIEADALNIIGSVYAQSGDYQNAEEYYKKCVEIRQLLNDNEGEVRALNSLGDLCMKTKEYEKAETLFLKCLVIEHKNYVHKGIVLYNLGETSYYLGKEKEAFDYIHKSIKIGKELNFTLMKVYCSLLLGQIYSEKKEFSTSLNYLKEALTSAEEVDSKDRIYLIHEQISLVYKSIGDFEKALIHHELYHTQKEVVFNEDNNQKIKTLQFQFQTQSLKKEAELERIKNIELQNAYDKIQQQRNEIKEKNKDIMDSINYAQKIQQALLPDNTQLLNNFSDSFILYIPKDIISGDFYWINNIENTIIVSIADCTGHGVPGAFMSMLGHSYLSQIILDQKLIEPSKILNYLDKKITGTLKSKSNHHHSNDGMDMALLCYNPINMSIQFSGAKNGMFLYRDKEVFIYKGDKMTIGGHDTADKKFSVQDIPVQKGDVIYLTTDGFMDQFGGPNGKKLKGSKLREKLLEISKLPMNNQFEILTSFFYDWKSDLEQIDDVCLIGFRI